MPNIKEDKDQELVTRAKAGDLEAFDLLISQYEKRVVGLCYRHLQQYEEACDLAQEVFIQVFHHLKDFKEQSSFSTWVYRVCLNACYNRQRWLRAKGRSKVDSLEGMLERRELPADSSTLMKSNIDTPLEQLQEKEVKALVWSGIRSLRKDFQDIIELIDLEGLRYEEAAKILRIPVNTVRSRLSRARQALKKTLARLMKQQQSKD